MYSPAWTLFTEKRPSGPVWAVLLEGKIDPPSGPLTSCDNVTDSLATGVPAALTTVPDTLEVRAGTSAKSMLPTSWPTPTFMRCASVGSTTPG